MAFPTQPAFVHEARGWDDGLVQHPAFKFMRAYEKAFTEDKTLQSQPYTDWHTADITYTDEVNLTWIGAQGPEKHAGMFNHLLSDWFQEPRFVTVSDTADGYKAFGSGVLYGNYKVPGEKKATDLQGRSWEFENPAAWLMTFRKDDSHPLGLKLASVQIFANTLPIFAGAVKRELLPLELLYKNAA